MMKSANILLALSLAVCVLALQGGHTMAAETTDTAKTHAEMKQARKEAAHRSRRIVFDNDGNEPVYYCEHATAEDLLAKRTTPLLGSQVDTILYCTWSSGFSYFTHNTKVGEVFTCTAEEPGKGPGSGFSKNKTKDFIEQGADPFALMVDFCRKNDIEIFWSMRMNDIHDAWGAWYSPFLFPPLKKAHPEWLMGTAENRPKNGAWTAVDYAVPEIRELAFKFFEEVCQNYDVDGVQLDFFRHLNYFLKPAMGEAAGQRELDMMTDLLRRIRTMADETALKKGHPILISVRVPDSVELCKILGFDLVRWMEEDLIDLLVVSGYFRLNPWETSVALGHKYGVPVYPCLSETRIRDKEASGIRSSLECYRARAMNVWHAGADGVYLFNFFNPNAPHWNELGSIDTLKPLDKVYTTGARGYGNLDFWYEGGERFMNRSIVNPSNPRSIAPGQTERVELTVGEKLQAAQNAQTTARLRFKGLTDASEIRVTLNGEILKNGTKADAWLEYALSPTALKQGPNTFEVALSRIEGEKVILEDLIVWVRFPEK